MFYTNAGRLTQSISRFYIAVSIRAVFKDRKLFLESVWCVVTCQYCGITIRADKVVNKFQCIITIDEENQLLLPLDVLENLFGKSVVKSFLEDVDVLKEQLIFLENVDYAINTKVTITNIYKKIFH